MIRYSLFVVVCWLLWFAGGCKLLVCLLFAVWRCVLLFVGCCSLFVVCCVLFVVVCRLLCGVRCVLSVVCNVLFAGWCVMLFVVCCVLCDGVC